VRQVDPAGVQQQARRGSQRGVVGVELVAQDGVADRLQVQAQLVRAAGDGLELQPGCCESTRLFPAQQPPARVAGLAGVETEPATSAW
jgi:hypothetical protein